jgi:hypothetical protein
MPENNSFDKQFLSDSLSYLPYKGEAKPYSGSSTQLDLYNKLVKEDIAYKQYITKTYGSYENYKNLNKVFTKGSVYDPAVDYMMDVTVITQDEHYKTDHISASEVIMESMSGVCSYNFIKKDGSASKVTGTLEAKYIPGNQLRTRSNFFLLLLEIKLLFGISINSTGHLFTCRVCLNLYATTQPT